MADETDARCLICGKPIKITPSVAGRKKYCSRKCLTESKRRRVNLVCAYCGREFVVSESKTDKKY